MKTKQKKVVKTVSTKKTKQLKATKHPPLHRDFKFDTTKLMNALLNGKL
jgi:hypothetical protein